ncbi:MAG TPA: hypothetical protein VMI54_02290 [Polyangiaceae bacterium]|nr:hypothetical protein [Polyangiaceae bacterium]
MTGDVAFTGDRPKGRAGVRLASAAVAAAFAIWLASCGGSAPAPRGETGEAALNPPACGVDEVREFRCDALLPRTSALPAPEPFETCPSAIEVKDAVFPPRSGAGRFDAHRTERARRRAPPGTQCCYSWCGKLKVVDPDKVVDRCREPLAFHESYCIAELEGGSKGALASEPYGACPAAIRPPDAAAFSVPNGALLDYRLTAARRKANEPLCCYGWCSIAPPGTALERTNH